VQALPITHFTMTSCLGQGLGATTAALKAARSGLKPCDFETVDIATWIGEVPGVDAVQLPPELARFDCRNNRLTLMGLQADGFAQGVREAVARYGADRVGVFIGTSTSGMLQTELAYRERDAATGALPTSFRYAETHNAYSAPDFICQYFGLKGPSVALSAACASSAKAFANAARMIAAGLIDAAIVGGVDSLCLTTLYGFRSLELTSSQPCRPYSAARDGISIGEAIGLALLDRNGAESALRLLGVGESSDAHHMSAPHPEGRSARQAMLDALASADLSADQIDYVNLHGTGTPSNDAAEGKAVQAVFGQRVPCSSTKASTGHTLGAAGAIEAVISLLAIHEGFMPAGLNVDEIDPTIAIDYLREVRTAPVDHVLSNSFGFGGANASLVFGRGA
jgi:3-oxoacyl-[acyl-carrier-protein] synthase-1